MTVKVLICGFFEPTDSSLVVARASSENPNPLLNLL
jgi:hypothetical protein